MRSGNCRQRPQGQLHGHIAWRYIGFPGAVAMSACLRRGAPIAGSGGQLLLGVSSGRSLCRDRSCDERDVAEPGPTEPDLMSARFGPQRRRRTSGRSRNARAPVFRHEYCTINHRSPETAARCANSAPVRARREAAERRAAEIASARAAKAAAASAARAARAADKAAAKARRREQREVKTAGGAELPAGIQRPNRRALVAAVIVTMVLIGLVSGVLAAHHGPGTSLAQQRTSGTTALSAKAHQTSGGRHQPRTLWTVAAGQPTDRACLMTYEFGFGTKRPGR